MEEHSAIQEHIEQLTKVQLLIGEHNLQQKALRNKIPNYMPPKIYFTLRNCYEGLRTQKLRFINHKNKLQSKVSDN